MSKVYVLLQSDTVDNGDPIIIGVVSKEEVANKFSTYLGWTFERELDDPELLNRIAKEGK